MRPPPFDTAAAGYDARFTHHRLGRLLRAAVRPHLFDAFRPGARVLELGCGTGEDAVALAARGVHVHATDAAPAMLGAAHAKARRHGVAGGMTFARLDLATLDAEPVPAGLYDGAFASFGVLNCLPDLRPTAAFLAARVRAGGRVVLVVMGPYCPWEWAWYGLRGNVGTALRRLSPPATAHLDGGARLQVWYPSPRRLRRAFAPSFRHVRTAGVGVLLPPTFARGVVDRWPRLAGWLARADAVAGAAFPGTWLNDHYLVVLERSAEMCHD